MDVTLENPGKRVPKVQGSQLLNLSGKRTEWVRVRTLLFAHDLPEHIRFRHFLLGTERKR